MIKEFYKYETFEQTILRVLLFSLATLFVLTFIFLFTGLGFEILKFRALFLKLSAISFILLMLMLSTSLIYFLVKNDALKVGIKEAFFRAKIKYKLEKALIDARIFSVRKGNILNDNTILVSLPKIKIELFKEDFHGRILIENTINFQDRFERLDISSAVVGYVQESVYLSDDRKYYIFSLSPSDSDIRLTFNSIEEINLSPKFNKKCLFIDVKNAKIPYYHWLLSGQTGSGKTYAIYSLLLQLRLQNVPVIVIDPKISNLSVFSEELGFEVETETEEILRKIKAVVNDMKQRKKDVKKAVKESAMIDSTALDLGFKPQYLVIDEYAALQLRLDRKEQQEMNGLIGQILLEGRSLGFYLVLAMQQANAQLINTNLREQFQVQIVLGRSGLQTYNVVFGAHLASLIPSRQMRTGEGWAMFSGRSVVPELVSFPYLNFNLMEEVKSIKV